MLSTVEAIDGKVWGSVMSGGAWEPESSWNGCDVLESQIRTVVSTQAMTRAAALG